MTGASCTPKSWQWKNSSYKVSVVLGTYLVVTESPVTGVRPLKERLTPKIKRAWGVVPAHAIEFTLRVALALHHKPDGVLEPLRRRTPGIREEGVK
jgi:hypothetical protein